MQVLKDRTQQYVEEYLTKKIKSEEGLSTPFADLYAGAIAYASVRTLLSQFGAEILHCIFERADKLRKIDAAIALCEDRRKLRTLYRLRMRLQLETEKARERH